MKLPTQTTTNLLFLVVVLYMTLFFQSGRMAFVGADEPRYARVAEEMTSSGDYIVPMLRGRPWLEKPPLYYWLAAASYRVMGVNEGSARLPAAFCGAGSVLLLLLVGKRLWTEEVAFFASLMLATSPLFFIFNRAASTDSLLAAFLNSGLLIYLVAFERQSLGLFLTSGVLLGLAVLAKGPVAMVLASMPIVPILILHPSRRRILGSLAGLGALLAISAPWFWLIIRRTGFDFIAVFVLNHNLARFFTTLHHHQHPFYYYLPVLVLGLYPWVPLLLLFAANLVFLKRFRGEQFGRGSGWNAVVPAANGGAFHVLRDSKFVYLLAWSLLPVLFFSTSRSKLPAYLLPVALPVALLIALALSRFSEVEYQRSRRFVFAVMAVLAGLLGSVGFVAASTSYQEQGLAAGLGLLLTSGTLLAWRLSSHGLSRALLALAGTSVTVVAYLALFLLPVVQDFHSTKYVARQALRQIPASERLFQYRYFHHTLDYYSGGRTVMEPLENLTEVREALANHSPLWIVMESKRLGEIQSQPDLHAAVVAKRGNVAVVKVSRQ